MSSSWIIRNGCELFQNNYNSQGGRGPTKLLLTTLVSLDRRSVIRYFRANTGIVLGQLHVPQRNKNFSETVEQLLQKFRAPRVESKYEKEERSRSEENFFYSSRFSEKARLKILKISQTITRGQQRIGKEINSINATITR